MHIPDGFLTVGIETAMGVISAGTAVYSFKKVRGTVQKEQVPLIASVAAFIFAAQMINFEVAKGTSGHFLGVVFAAILFGPYVANILLTVLLAVQMALFQDGGLLALGANLFNMGVVGAFGGYLVHVFLKEMVGGFYGTMVGSFAAGWFAVVMAAVSCSVQLWMSGVSSLARLLGSMLSVHIKIGVAEGILTMVLVAMAMKLQSGPVAVDDCPESSVDMEVRA